MFCTIFGGMGLSGTHLKNDRDQRKRKNEKSQVQFHVRSAKRNLIFSKTF